MFWDVLGLFWDSFRTFWDVLGCFGMFLEVLGQFGTFCAVFNCCTFVLFKFSTFLHYSDYIGTILDIFWMFLDFLVNLLDVWGCFGNLLDVLGRFGTL